MEIENNLAARDMIQLFKIFHDTDIKEIDNRHEIPKIR